MSGFISDPKSETDRVFIQWKGTDACFDFYCECGEHCHFDGFFAYVVQCPVCEQKWEMPCFLTPRKVCADTYSYEPEMMQANSHA
jgi:hypothetical protein